MSVRLVAVLGYSSGRADGLHDLCAARLRHAECLAGDDDVVLFSGWRAQRSSASEAGLMRAAWSGANARLIADASARNTAENARAIADTARRVAAAEVVLVTSRWHAFRARALVRAALPGVNVRTPSPGGAAPVALLARELLCFALLPFQLIRLRLRRR